MGKGLSKGDVLAFFWVAPTTLRISVNGAVSGDVEDEKLPRMLHVGFLGDDPTIPEVKASVSTGFDRLFKEVGSGGPPVKDSPEFKEPVTGLTLPGTLSLDLPGQQTPMFLLGCGVRVRKLGPVNVKVYAAGSYVEPCAAKIALESFKAAGDSGSLDQDFYMCLSDPRLKFHRCLHLVFARDVQGKQVSDTLGERLKGKVPPEVGHC